MSRKPIVSELGGALSELDNALRNIASLQQGAKPHDMPYHDEDDDDKGDKPFDEDEDEKGENPFDNDEDENEDDEAENGISALVSQFQNATERLIRRLRPQPSKLFEANQSFAIISEKMKADNPALADYDWIGWYSNNFKDREDEIISEHAISQYVSKVATGDIPPPELWWGHVAGTKHGQAVKVFQVGHFVVAVGTFDSEADNPLVKTFKSWYDKKQDVTMSHGFMYDPETKRNGVYYDIETYEISTLPAGSEANPYTKFNTKDASMGVVSTQQREMLENEFGAEFAETVVGRAESYGEQLRSQGVSFKSKPPNPDGTFNAETLLTIAALADMQKTIKAKIDSETDVANQLAQVSELVEGLGDGVKRLTQAITTLTKRRAPSVSDETVISDDDAHANFIQDKNETNERPSVLRQMRMGAGALGEGKNGNVATD